MKRENQAFWLRSAGRGMVSFSLAMFLVLVGELTSSAQTPFTDIPANLGNHAPVAFNNLAKLAPDKQFVAYVTANNLGMTESTIWIAKPDGSDRKALVIGGDNFSVTNPVWSPDSKQIVYLKIVETDYAEFDVVSKFELWIVSVDATENRLLSNTPLLNPAVGYGGQTNIAWNTNGELEFDDNTAFPIKRYALNVVTGNIRQIVESVGDLRGRDVGQQPSNVPSFKQCDSRWKGKQLGSCSGKTICSHGCAITSTTMVLKYFGANIDPDIINTWLKNHQGYVSRCNISWAKAANYHTGVTFVARFDSANVSRLRTELDAGYPVIVCTWGSTLNH